MHRLLNVCSSYEATALYCVLSFFNIRSEFSIKIRARPLVKIDHVIFIYVTAPHSERAVLAITHENRALLKMASRFAQVGEEEISQIISDSIPTNTERQTACSVSIFKGKSEIKQLKFCLCFSVKLICRLFLKRKLKKKNCYRFMFSL